MGFVVDARGGGGVDVVAGVEVGDHVLVALRWAMTAQLNLRIRRRLKNVQRPSGTNALRISRPSSPRTGMFCRLGFEDERRPVAVTA